jgi:hypothetical protein
MVESEWRIEWRIEWRESDWREKRMAGKANGGVI